MNDYVILDVRSLDHLKRKEGLVRAKDIDRQNNEHYRHLVQEMVNIQNMARKSKVLGAVLQSSNIPLPPCYVDAFNLHRDRNEVGNLRLAEMSKVYLEAFGFWIIDASVIKISPYGSSISLDKLIEPYQVIDKAIEHASMRGDDPTEIVTAKYKEIIEQRIKLATSPPLYPSCRNTIFEDSEIMT